MEKRLIDPWKWGEQTNSVQAIEIKKAEGTLYCSGQVAINADGQVIAADMRTQLLQIIQNLEQLINEAGYECRNILQLNVFTTSMNEFFSTCMDVYPVWIAKHGIRQVTTMVEVQGLFSGLTIELEATVVK